MLKYSDKEEKIYEESQYSRVNADFLQIFENSNDKFTKNKKNIFNNYKIIGKTNYRKFFDNYYNDHLQGLCV